MQMDQSGFVLRGAPAVPVEEKHKEMSANLAFKLFYCKEVENLCGEGVKLPRSPQIWCLTLLQRFLFP